MKKKRKVQMIAGVAGGIFATGFFLLPMGQAVGEVKQEEITVGKSSSTDVEEVFTATGTSGIPSKKTEMVTAKASATGVIESTSVEVNLSSVSGTDLVEDLSDLSDIKNKEGNEEFVEKEGIYYWENLGEEISYEGESDVDLPVTMTISYELDGKTVTPEELAGQSGKLKMTFSYENQTVQDVEVDGESIETIVPYMAMSMAFLSDDVFSDVEVENGDLIQMSGETVAVGYVYPGLDQYLNQMEDMDFPQEIVITAQVEDFSMDFTATVLTNGMVADLEEDDLTDLEEMRDALLELGDATDELEEAANSLYSGSTTFQTYLSQYVDGVEALNTGINDLKTGVDALNAGSTALAQGASGLQTGLETLQSTLAAVDVSSLVDNQATCIALVESSGLDDTSKAALEAYINGAAALASSMSDLKSGVDTLTAGSQSLSSGVATYTAGVGSVASGVATLASGSSTLVSSGSELESGYATLVSGLSSYASGIATYNEEGIDELESKADGELTDLLKQVRALRIADTQNRNYSGAFEEQECSVSYIIETEEIE